jgi:hypothetical protein
VNQHYRQRPFHPGNPLANVLVVIAGIVVISLSLTLGVFIFLAVTAFLVVTAAIMGVRNWWFRRKGGQSAGTGRTERRASSDAPHVIEGEFREIRGPGGDRRDP